MIEEWKAGQQVAIVHGDTIRLAIIYRVTPSGIVVIGGTKFNPDGSERSAKNRWTRRSIERVTQAHLDKVARAQRESAADAARTWLDRCRLRDLTDDQLVAIAAFVETLRTPKGS